VLETYEAYNPLSAYELEQLTHQESPWLNARGDAPIDAASHAVISEEDMRVCYAAQAADE